MRATTIVVLLAVVLFGALYQFETTLVPAWTVTVVDEQGVPYAGQRVDEFCANYSLELGAAQYGEARRIDAAGRIDFPRRTLRISLIGRVGRLALTSINRFMHGSTGTEAYLASTGPQGIKNLQYEPDKPPPPDRLVLPRNASQAPRLTSPVTH